MNNLSESVFPDIGQILQKNLHSAALLISAAKQQIPRLDSKILRAVKTCA